MQTGWARYGLAVNLTLVSGRFVYSTSGKDDQLRHPTVVSAYGQIGLRECNHTVRIVFVIQSIHILSRAPSGIDSVPSFAIHSVATGRETTRSVGGVKRQEASRS